MTELQKIFITVKTYPTISKKYDELVCTAGILEDGSWIRIYPLPFRKLEFENRYKKYQWIEAKISKNQGDVRPESYKLDDVDSVELIGDPVNTKQDWMERKQIVFKKNDTYIDLKKLIEEANNNELSLAAFKPTKILDFKVEEVSREWSKDKLESLENKAQQYSLFQTVQEIEEEFTTVNKLPYKFSYTFEDCNGVKSTMMIEDWEIGALYWNCLERNEGDEEKTKNNVREKYFDSFLKKDLTLFLGTTKKFHGWAKNPFVIVGVFYPPKDAQESLF